LCVDQCNRGDWDYFKVIQKIREEHTKKTRSQGTAENRHVGHCTHTAKSTNIEVQYSRFNTETNDTRTMNSNNGIAATVYSLGT